MRVSVFLVVALLVTLGYSMCGFDHRFQESLSLGNNSLIYQQVKSAVHDEWRESGFQKRAMIRIAVVFHVLYDTAYPATRLSEDTINAEMDYLNRWFNAQNAFYTTTDMWSSRVASASDLNVPSSLTARDHGTLAAPGMWPARSAPSCG